MQFKIGQQITTIMNMFNIFVQHTIEIFFVMEDFIMINQQKHYTNIYMIG